MWLKLRESNGMSYKNNTQVDVLPGVDLCKNRRKDIFLLALQHRLLVIFISDSLYTMSSEPTRLLKLSKPLLNSDFVLEIILGDLGRLTCLEHTTEPSHHSADGSSVAAISFGGFSAGGRRKPRWMVF